MEAKITTVQLRNGKLGKTYATEPVNGAVPVYLAIDADATEFEDIPVNVHISNIQIINPDVS